MNNDDLLKGLSFIRPNSEWVWRGNDYNGLEWLDTTSEKPTFEEIQNAVNAYKTKQEQEKLQAASAKQALLDRLGITEEEAKLLLS